MCTLGFELLDHSDEVADRAREPIEPDNHLGLAGLDLVQLARQTRPRPPRAPCRSQQHVVRRAVDRSLFLGGDPRVADQTAYDGPTVCTHSAIRQGTRKRSFAGVVEGHWSLTASRRHKRKGRALARHARLREHVTREVWAVIPRKKSKTLLTAP
jgi:hypothetical protein